MAAARRDNHEQAKVVETSKTFRKREVISSTDALPNEARAFHGRRAQQGESNHPTEAVGGVSEAHFQRSQTPPQKRSASHGRCSTRYLRSCTWSVHDRRSSHGRNHAESLSLRHELWVLHHRVSTEMLRG